MSHFSISQDHFLIFGAGASGKSALKLLQKLGAKVSIIEGMGTDFIDEYDVMILSPGIAREHVFVQKFLNAGKLVIGEIELASRFLKAPILAVTGSNGKTTVCTMISEFLENLGKKVFLGGNIGTPLSEASYKEQEGESFDYIVCEVSSFQLESTSNFSPLVGAIINLSFTHQERYEKFEDYARAKMNIAYKSQTFLFSAHPLIEKYLGEISGAKKQLTSSLSYGYEFMSLVGDHNKLNFEHCFQIIKSASIEFSRQQAQSFIQNFEAPEFRVQKIAQRKNLLFYNDSKSTNLESTLVALKCFKPEETVLICGGKLREDSIDQFEVLNKYNLKRIYAYGEAAQLLENIVDAVRCSKLENVLELLQNDLVKLNHSKSNNPVMRILFSPGFPSFDLYRNYIERGRHFNQLVKEIICF